MNFKVYCRYEDFRAKLNFYIFQENPDGSRDLCTSLDRMVFERYNELVSEAINNPLVPLEGKG